MLKSIIISIAALFISTAAFASEPVDLFRFGPGPHMLDPLAHPKKVKNPKHSHDRQALGKKSIAAAKSAPPVEIQTHNRAITAITGASNAIVSYARTQIGNGAIYGRRNLWCARFMNVVLERTGHKGTGSDMARDFASYGTRVSGPVIGAIAVMGRGKRGGHVGIVSGIDAKGNPIIISGNHSHRVGEGVYPKSRIYAYVMP